MIQLCRMRRNEVTELFRVTDSHNLFVQLNIVLLPGPLRWCVLFVSVAATFAVSISFAVSAKFFVSGPLYLIISYSLPGPLLVSVFASVCLSVWSVSAFTERSRVAAVQNLLVQLCDMIEWLAGRLR